MRKVPLENRENLDRKVFLAQEDYREREVLTAPCLDQKEILANQDLRENPVYLIYLDLLANKDQGVTPLPMLILQQNSY
jgi:hypothetical protein